MLQAPGPDTGEPGTSDEGTTATDPARWVDLHGDALFAWVFARVGDRDTAETLVQEAFVAALEARDTFRGEASERSWLIAILKHKLMDHYRSNTRRRSERSEGRAAEAVDAIHDRHGRWAKGPADRPGSWPDDVADPAEREELRAWLRRCLERLPAGLGEAFRMRCIAGESGDAVCQALGITPTNLWQRLHRSRMLLRKCLDKNWLGSSDTR